MLDRWASRTDYTAAVVATAALLLLAVRSRAARSPGASICMHYFEHLRECRVDGVVKGACLFCLYALLHVEGRGIFYMHALMFIMY